MEKGFLLTEEEKKKKREELKRRLKHKIKSKQLGRVSRKQREQMIRHKTNNSHSSQNIMNCVANLQQDCKPYEKEKNKVQICKKFEKKHSFLQENYFHIYRQVCYGDLKDLNLLKKMLTERDRWVNPNNDVTVEDSTKKIGEMLTKKYCPDLEEKLKNNKE
jgi:phosphodiesterase/alkaline phosphatase D-like protein|tara:strand:- start:971 stop:1453 length:483 start_codon:yes stop_codon:yes gene_type:complete